MSEQEKSSQAVHAPYNFVEFPRQVLEDRAGAVGHSCLDASRKTGEIQITLIAETPVFVSDGDKDDPHFFRTPGGSYALPGSTVRGMARENMQILSFAPVRAGEDFEDFQIYFRQMAGKNNDITGSLKDYYHQALGVKPPRNKLDKATPEKVESGWICCENGTYFIYPTGGSYLRVSRKHPDVRQFQKQFPEMEYKKRRKAEDRANNARTVDIAYIDDGRGKVKDICPLEQARPGMKRGALLYTGKPVGRVPNGLYIFPEADYNDIPVTLSKEDELSYREDWENRRNNLNAYYDPDFWKLPEEGQAKPVFYIRFEGHTYCGMSLFLRIGYRYPISKGLPQGWDETAMDYPRAILGYAGKENSQRSRVSFSDCMVCGNTEEMMPVQIILAGPKPSYYAGYIKASKEGKAVHYNNEGFELRGFKQYWLKEPVKTSVAQDKEKVSTKLRPLPVGTQFSGIVRFKNLTPAELGLLLWSLRLEEGCYQTIGMGKPYGYGRMKLIIDSMTEYSADDLYSGDLCAPGGVTLTGDVCSEKVEEYIQQYDQKAAEDLQTTNRSLKDFGRIQDFFYMRRLHLGIDTSYMDIERGEYQKAQQPMPTVQEFSGRPEDAYESVHSENEQEEKLNEDLLIQLKNKFSHSNNRQKNLQKRKKRP